jgi:hypothetical protein
LSTCQEPLGGAGRPAKTAATHATRKIGAIFLIIDSSPQKNLFWRIYQHPDFVIVTGV